MIAKTSSSLFIVIILTVKLMAGAASFSGIVREATTGVPLENVLVLIKDGPGMTHTKEDGTFLIDNITPINEKQKSYGHNRFILWDGISNKLHLYDMETPTNIAIYTLQGRRIFSFTTGIPQSNHITIPRLSHGFYLLRITCAKNSITRKVLNIGRRLHIDIPDIKHRRCAASKEPKDSLFTLIFLRDGYYKKENLAADGMQNIQVVLKPDPSYYVFDQQQLHTYEISITDENIQWLDANWEKEEYVSGSFTHNGVNCGEVGVRYKGSYSLQMCFDENGNKINPKISLKVKFDKYNDDTRFHGLKRLNLHALNHDPTYLHDRLAYSIFREMGIYAPRAVHCKVYLNGKYHGLFAAVEQVDGRFTKNHFSEHGDGNVYKQAWPCKEHKDWYADPEVLKTNTDSSDVSKMVAFADAVSHLNGANFNTEIYSWIDLHYMMRYIAVDRAIVNWDGIMTWYTDKDWVGNHNYYWYEEENPGGKFWLIPWDMDATFSRIDEIFERLGVPRWYEGKDDTTLYKIQFENNLWIRPPARDNLITLLAENAWELYQYYGTVLLKGPFAESSMQSKLDAWIKQIDNSVATEPYGHGYEQWKSHANTFSVSPNFYRGNFKDLMDTVTFEVPPVDQTPQQQYTGLSLLHDNNFELVAPDTVLQHSEAKSNPQTSYTLKRNYTDPLSGTADVIFTVIFRDAPGAWEEWAGINFLFEQSGVDINDFSYCIIDLSCESNRDIRINLGSDAYPNMYGPFYGWNTAAGPEITTVVLPMYKVAYPEWGCQEYVLDKVLHAVTHIKIEPVTRWNSDGTQMINDPDTCVLHIDNIRFLM